MRSLGARLLDLIPTGVRQYIPLNGIYAQDWQPSTAIALYWFESVLLVTIAVVLCWRLQRRAAHSTDPEEQEDVRKAGINPRDVLLFHGGSLIVFGVFLGVILAMLVQKRHIAPFDWTELRGGADALMLVIALGFALDMVTFRSMDVAAVRSRVDACLGRWALLWLLGFVGTGLLVFTGKPGAFIGLFAILKAVWEGWGALARIFGWKPAAMDSTSAAVPGSAGRTEAYRVSRRRRS